MSDVLEYQQALTEVVVRIIGCEKDFYSTKFHEPKDEYDRTHNVVIVKSHNYGSFMFSIYENTIIVLYLHEEITLEKSKERVVLIKRIRENIADGSWLLSNLHYPGVFEEPVIFDENTIPPWSLI